MPSETASNRFWPDGIRLVISISMQFEAGGQPSKGTDSPFPLARHGQPRAAAAGPDDWVLVLLSRSVLTTLLTALR
jgi:hypothetical protein